MNRNEDKLCTYLSINSPFSVSTGHWISCQVWHLVEASWNRYISSKRLPRRAPLTSPRDTETEDSWWGGWSQWQLTLSSDTVQGLRPTFLIRYTSYIVSDTSGALGLASNTICDAVANRSDRRTGLEKEFKPVRNSVPFSPSNATKWFSPLRRPIRFLFLWLIDWFMPIMLKLQRQVY
jgi:hypothetical protein